MEKAGSGVTAIQADLAGQEDLAGDWDLVVVWLEEMVVLGEALVLEQCPLDRMVAAELGAQVDLADRVVQVQLQLLQAPTLEEAMVEREDTVTAAPFSAGSSFPMP